MTGEEIAEMLGHMAAPLIIAGIGLWLALRNKKGKKDGTNNN